MSRLAHDMRAPLAQAKTLALLLQDATEEERSEYLPLLLGALERLDQLIGTLENADTEN